MQPPDAVGILLHKAAQDEAVLRELLPKPEFDAEVLGFHAQQAVEKFLKAWLCYVGIDYPKVHNPDLLVDLLKSNGKTLPDELNDLGRLTPFATMFRVEGVLAGRPSGESQSAFGKWLKSRNGAAGRAQNN
jgi:HEPN domain-containing protein